MRMAKADLSKEDFRQLLEFSKFGFRGTLTAALVGLIIVPTLVFMLKDSEHVTPIVIGYSTSLVVGVVAFGYFSLRRVPDLVANLLRGELAIGEKNCHCE